MKNLQLRSFHFSLHYLYTDPMTTLRMLAASVVAVTFASCASKPADEYDTSNPYGVADGGQADGGNYQAAAPSNPVYDTPAAYEESTGTTPAPEVNMPAPAAPRTASAARRTAPSARTAPAAPATASGGAKVHVVAKGDSLWSISKKYAVPVASIKAANNMTSDVVVLGKKMVIPAH